MHVTFLLPRTICMVDFAKTVICTICTSSRRLARGTAEVTEVVSGALSRQLSGICQMHDVRCQMMAGFASAFCQ